jgi:hypothetical protein
MDSRTRNNYKAKWLAALADDVETPSVNAANLSKGLVTVKNVDADTALSLNKIKEGAIEAAGVAKRVLELMDEESTVAGVNFGVCGVSVDNKLAQLPVPIILRRLRDTLKIAEARIGMLSVAATEYYKAHQKLELEIRQVQEHQSHLHRALLETSYIGARPSTADMEDYQDARAGEYARFGLAYEDLEDDWLDNALNENRTRKGTQSDESSDSDNDEPGSSDMRIARTGKAASSPRRNGASSDVVF